MSVTSRSIVLGFVAAAALWAVSSTALAQTPAPATPAASSSSDTSVFYSWYVVGSYETWFLLTPMSIAAFALLVDYSINFRRDVLMPPPVVAQIQTMFEDRDYRGVLEFTSAEPSALSYVIHNALSEAAGGYTAMERAMNESLKERVAQMMARAEICNIIGQLAPMVGLFGTVRAMIIAFTDMENAGADISPAKAAAGGLRKAMVKTFWGLAIGTLGLAIYSFFRLHIVKLGNQLMHQSAEFIDTFKPGKQPAAAPAGGGAAAAPRPGGPTPQPAARR